MFTSILNSLLVVFLPFIVSSVVETTQPSQPQQPDPVIYPLPDHQVLDGNIQSYTTDDHITIQFCGLDCTPRQNGLITGTLATGETVLNRGDVQIIYCETNKPCQYATKRIVRVSVLKSGKSSLRYTTSDHHYVVFSWCADENKCTPANNQGETHKDGRSTYLLRDMTITVSEAKN